MEDSFSSVGSASGKVLIVTAGAGDCRIHVTDCATANIVQSMTGHTGHVLSLCLAVGSGGNPSSVFASGSGEYLSINPKVLKYMKVFHILYAHFSFYYKSHQQ
jgi:hypothetical protein